MWIDISNDTRICLNANKADRLTLDQAGSSKRPVYFVGGVPLACTNTFVYQEEVGDVSNLANSNLYTLKSGDTMTGNLTAPAFVGPLIGNADTATTATTATNVAWSGVTSKPSYYDAKAIKGITRSGTTFTYTCMDGTTGTFTQQDNNTTYTSLKNPYALTLQGNGTTLTNGTYDGSAAKTVNITPAAIGAAASSHSHSYLPLSGGAMSGRITTIYGTPSSTIGNMYVTAAIQIRENNAVGSAQSDILYAPTLGFHWSGRVACNLSLHSDGALYLYNNNGNLSTFKAGAIYGAVWNDYAEYRTQKETIEPGYCVASSDNGQVYKTTEKFQACDGIVSDTFGFAIGETDECKTPLAVAGRVLAYFHGERSDYHSGDTVCAGPEGKVMKMTREEIKEYPDRIVGIVSEIPEYEIWGSGNVEVNNRIWIKVK